MCCSAASPRSGFRQCGRGDPSAHWLPLFAVSYPWNFDIDAQITVGYVTDDRVVALDHDPIYWENVAVSDYAATAGSSGAPVFNIYQQWIAIHVGGFDGTGGPELNYTLPMQP